MPRVGLGREGRHQADTKAVKKAEKNAKANAKTAAAPAAAPAAPATRETRNHRTEGQPGRVAMIARERACGADWKADKAAGKTGDQKWPQYWSDCNKRKKAQMGCNFGDVTLSRWTFFKLKSGGLPSAAVFVVIAPP